VVQRVHASRELYCICVLAEEKAEGHMDALVPALVSAVGDEDTNVAAKIVGATHQVRTPL
jgi:hypothetical protein